MQNLQHTEIQPKPDINCEKENNILNEYNKNTLKGIRFAITGCLVFNEICSVYTVINFFKKKTKSHKIFEFRYPILFLCSKTLLRF